MSREDFMEFCRIAGELSKAADTLGMRNYRLTVTPKDFMMLQDHAARVTDSAVVMVSARNVSNLPIEVKW